MARLSVEVVTPERRLLHLEADEVVAPGANGLFGVRPGHAPFLTLVEPGQLTVTVGGETQRFFVGGGFVQVGPSMVRVLADQAEPVDGIDAAAAKQRLANAEKRLSELSPSDPKADLERETIRRERARLDAAGRR